MQVSERDTKSLSKVDLTSFSLLQTILTVIILNGDFKIHLSNVHSGLRGDVYAECFVLLKGTIVINGYIVTDAFSFSSASVNGEDIVCSTRIVISICIEDKLKVRLTH